MSYAPFINCVSMCKGWKVPKHFMRQCTLVNILLFLLKLLLGSSLSPSFLVLNF